MDTYKWFDCVIRKLVENGKKDIVIFPMGFWGKRAKSILNDEFGIKEVGCLDNHIYDMNTVFPINKMPDNYKDCTFLLTAEDEYLRYSLSKQLVQNINNPIICDVFENDPYVEEICNSDKKVHLDFLCVGFQKCGTTSLHQILETNENIYLPKTKETYFATHIKSSNLVHFKTCYADATVEQKVGGIEPSYFNRAESVYRYFGEDLNIIFCLGNPAKALFSLYKMHMRDGVDLEHLNKYGISMEAFKKWVPLYVERFRYIDYINYYLKYFPINSMKFLISEEMYKNPYDTINDLQSFIGLSDEQMIGCEAFPHVNKGKWVTKNYACALVNNELQKLYFQAETMELQNEIGEIRRQIRPLMVMEWDEKIPQPLYDSIFKMYEESIHQLEELLGRTLKGVWY